MKYKNLMTLLATGLLTIVAYSQGGHHCSRVKSLGGEHARSARLSNHYINLTERYDVHFYKLDVELERTSVDIEGEVEIHVTALEPLDTFLFELYDDFWIDDVVLNGTTPIPFSREESAVIVPVDFDAGESFFVRVIYEGTPPDGDGPLGGGGMTNDFSFTWGNQVTWSLSQPFAAYEWFPCKQSLTDKADSVYVFVTTDESNMAGSNGILTGVTDMAGGKKRYEWKSNYPIDYYLISVAVAEYVEYTIYANPTGVDPIMIQNFIYNNPATLSFFEDDIDETADYLEHYSELFGLYPFANEKYGHCMAPIGGGMEHQTMTTQGFFQNWLTAHELGHQWFGDYVTCATWADIWLNEGFASYSEELMYEEFYPGQEVTSMANRHENIMSFSGGSVWVEDSLNSSRIFSGRLTYNKGAAIIHTMRFLINDDDTFFEILRTYLTTHANSTARMIDFKTILEDITETDYTAFFNEWYYGEGFPAYSIEYAQTDGSLIIALDQIVSMPDVTPLFTNDLEIVVEGAEGAVESFRLTDIDALSTVHYFDFDEDVTNIFIDPYNWIINVDGGVDENLNLVSLVEHKTEFKIYPNPTTDILIVETENASSFYAVFDASGKTIMNGALTNSKNTIDVTDLPAGNYFIRVNGGQQMFTKK